METTQIYALHIIVAAIAGLWLLMLLGAWVNALQQPPRWLTPIELTDEHAKPIMKALVRELVTLVLAIAAAGTTIIAVLPGRAKLETLTAELLCQVKGTHTDPGVIATLKNIAEIPTPLQQSAKLSSTLLGQIGRSQQETSIIIDPESIVAIKPDDRDRNAYDNRSIGIAHDKAGSRFYYNNNLTKAVYHYGQAKQCYKTAIAQSKAALPGDPRDDHKRLFTERLDAQNVGINFGLALCQTNQDLRITALRAVADEYETLKTLRGNETIYFTNLAMTYSQLGEFEKAIATIKSIAKVDKDKLDDSKKDRALEILSDLEENPELKPLADYVTKTAGRKYGKGYLYEIGGSND